MAAVFHLYYVVPTQQAYTSDRSLVNSGNCPNLRFTGKYLIFLHLLNSEETDEDGNFTDLYTGYDSAISASAAVDNNNNWTDGGKLNAALNSGTSYPAIALNSFSPASSPVRPVGRIKLSSTEEVNYNAVTVADNVYTFTCANADFQTEDFTPSASYASGAAVIVRESPIIKASGTAVDISAIDTGILSFLLNTKNSVYETIIEGAASIADCQLEFTVYKNGEEDLIIQIPVVCLNKMDYAGPDSPPPLTGPDWTASDSRYFQNSESTTQTTLYLKSANSSDVVKLWFELDNGAVKLKFQTI